MSKTPDESISIINKGRTARLLRSSADDLLIDREESLLEQMVNLYRSDKLTDPQLRGMVGELAALRWMRTQIETQIRRGDAEAERTQIGA
jgi:hypothetical protein